MADVTSTFAAKDIGFTSTVNRMQKSLAGFQSNLGGFATKLAGLAAAFVGVQQSVAAFNSALAMGGRLDDLSKTTGASAGELLLLEKAFLWRVPRRMRSALPLRASVGSWSRPAPEARRRSRR
jgi:hypothetical protein